MLLVYTPIVEVVVNAIQAIESSGHAGGKIEIRVHRSKQLDMEGGLPDVCSVEIKDNGIGFTEENREAFDTLYTEYKADEGGKGFGRFICLKYFEDVHVESCFRNGSGCQLRTFSMGKVKDIIVNEAVCVSQEQKTGTTVHLCQLKKAGMIDKKLDTIAKNLVEKLLPYFVAENYTCPEIILLENDGSQYIPLNDFVNIDRLSAVIVEIPVEIGAFTLMDDETPQEFSVRVFKIVYPKNQRSKISLVAHKREVSGSALYKYIPEFIDEFYDTNGSGEIDKERNYIIKAYVFSPYLDGNVSLERGGFEFAMEGDLLHGIGQIDIERKVANIAKEAVGSELKKRQEKKKELVHAYVDEEAPWHKETLNTIDLTELPYKPSNEDIEIRLQKAKLAQETRIKNDVKKLLDGNNLESQEETVAEIIKNISGTGKSDLVHYIALRKSIIDILKKSLELDENGRYAAEGVVHDIIFPRRSDTDTTPYRNHNLWLIDERLNFTQYVSSDKELNGPNTERPDLLVYNKRILFRGENEESNPVTIFEFKKPDRDNFVNPSSAEDPVQQIVRYVNDIRDGKYKTPKGRRIRVADTTPCYGYVVCDLTPRVEMWLKREKNFTCMPDSLGWFNWMSNISLYIEVISWEKVLKDAQMRNSIFFKKLGI